MSAGLQIRRLLEEEHRKLLAEVEEVEGMCRALPAGGGEFPAPLGAAVDRLGRDLTLHLRREEEGIGPELLGLEGGRLRRPSAHEALRDRFRALQWVVLVEAPHGRWNREALVRRSESLGGALRDHFRREEEGTFARLAEASPEAATGAFHRMRTLEEDFGRLRARTRTP